MAQIEKFSALETQVLSLINEEKNTFDLLLDNVGFSEQLLNQTLEGLQAKNLIVFDNKTKKYCYDTPIDNDMVILDGNIMLPTTIIRIPEKGIMYISRGNWYQFPIDFDIRRIIWNVRLLGKNNSNLVELISTSILKQRKSKIKHNPIYDNLKRKIVPYNDNIGLLLNSIGDEVTDISILFKIIFDKKDSSSAIHKKFMVSSEIDTKELLSELQKPVTERDWNNIKLNQIYNFSDFIFKDNEIPVNFVDNKLSYVKIASVRKGYELVYYDMDSLGLCKKIDSEYYEDVNSAFEKLRDLFSGMATSILLENNFMCELEA